ncbi:conserved hypothetical protein [Methylocella tundrae]|uniref:DUF58 domain-containing protein n=1 Tax=Methylocella tundrae TaxID=227605 RepID=A0A8B6M262_METTU|nr:DUF58 domain-containing protein [Methylocella tundrae]VTZ48320.1 conserved hypothetical protein [Methylocella tundrae]
MGLSYAAMGRLSAPRRIREASSASRHGVYTSIADLVALHSTAREFSFPPRHPVQSLHSGGHPSHPFDGHASEDALPPLARGEETGVIERRAGARARQAFGPPGFEEKVRPALVVVDQRPNMFFGSRRSMKSVAAAEAAALCVWGILDHGAPIGGVVFNDALIERVEPRCSSTAAMRLIEAVATQNAELRADSTRARGPSKLDAALEAAARLAPQDHLIVVISDFEGQGPRTRESLIRLAAKNEVLAVLVYDPFLLDLPKTGAIIVSRGELQIDLEFGSGRIRRSLFDFADARAQDILAFERTIGVPVLPLSAAEETAPQMRRWVDQSFWRQVGG